MGIQNISENAVLVLLPPEPEIAEQLTAVNEILSKRRDLDVIIDFSRVDILTSANISNLLVLYNWLHGRGQRLVLYNVSVLTKGIFTVAGLDPVFEFADDKSAALAALQPAKPPSP